MRAQTEIGGLAPGEVEVRPVAERDLMQFVKVPWPLYQGDPHWVPPLLRERYELFSPRHNPFFQHAEARYFVALRGGKPVGRISAQVCHEHLRIHQDRAGFFGAFESVDDPGVAGALFAAAESFLREKGMTKARGPFTLSINEEAGLLVDGFDCPPFMMMGHNPRYYPALVEAAGYHKVMDLFAWRYDVTRPVPERALRVAEAVRAYPGLKIRGVRLDKKGFDEDLHTLLDVFNDAWKDNWGFVPMTPAEIEKSAADLKWIVDPALALIAEVNGESAAICLALPNLNEALVGLDGKLFPFGVFRLLWRLKVRRPKTARLILLGIRRKFRGKSLGGLSVLLYALVHKNAKARGFVEGELSWTLESNHRINNGIEFMGGVKKKTYRIYEKEL